MRNKITFHIALYCLLATATVGAMEITKQPTQQISLQPDNFYINNRHWSDEDEFYLLAKDGTEEKIEAKPINQISLNIIPLVLLYNRGKISSDQYDSLTKKTKNFTEPMNIAYCDEKNIISKVLVIPPHRIYTSLKKLSSSSNFSNQCYEITINGAFAEMHENFDISLENNNKLMALKSLGGYISHIQLQMLGELINQNNDVYVTAGINNFYRVVKSENLTENHDKTVQTNPKKNNRNNNEKIQIITNYTKIKSFISSCLTKRLLKNVLGIGILIGAIIAAYKYNKFDGFIKTT